MALFTIETDYPNMLELVNMCLVNSTENCLLPSEEELTHIFSPMLKADSEEREIMACRLIAALENIKNRREIAAVADRVWEKRRSELQLNSQLYEEAIKCEVDYSTIEELLKKGASPTDIYDYDYCGDTVFSQIVNDRESKAELPKLTELFLRYGMNINATVNDCLHTLTWIRNIYGFETMQQLFETKMSWLDAESYIGDMVGDMWQFEEFNSDDSDSMESLFWAMRETMYLAALFADDFEKCEWAYKLIRPDLNKNTSLKEFLDWDKFDYEYIADEATANHRNNSLDGKMIIIKRKRNKEIVWKITFFE